MTPEKVRVHLGERAYDIFAAPGLLSASAPNPALDALGRLTENRPVLIVADSNTARLGADQLQQKILTLGAASCAIHTFEAGETSKDFRHIEAVCRSAFQAKLDRHGVIVALGGGVTGDMAGFAASIFMRGIDCIQVPTSLLAMIDSSVGGKTGVDLPDGKNLIGTFHQPKLVLIDIDFLRTLPPDQIRSGLAELLKHAILFDPELFQLLEENSETLLALKEPALAARLIARSCALKAAVVAEDERESSSRALLNLGHSFGHAVEKLQHFRGFSHGDAVGFGISVAVTLAVKLKMLAPEDAGRITALLALYHLPHTVSGLAPEDIFETMRGDKKNYSGKIRLVLPLKIGRAAICDNAAEEQIRQAIGEHCE